MLKIFKYLSKRDVAFLIIATGLIILQVYLDLTIPDYTAKMTESLEILDRNEVLRNGGIMLGLAFASMCAAIATGYLSSHIAANFSRTLRSKLYDQIATFSDAEMNKFSTSSLITRTTNDVVNMQMFIALGMQVLIKAPILAIWAICKISSTSIEWTTAVLICVIVIVACVGVIVLVCYPRFKKIQKLTDDLNNAMRENVTGVRVIRAFNAEEYQTHKFAITNKAVTANNLFTARATGAMMPTMNLCMNFLALSIYWIGAYLINQIPAESIATRGVVFANMVAFTQYALQVVIAFMMLILIFILLPRAIVSARRITEVIDTTSSITFPTQNRHPRIRGEVTFKNVTFAYPDAQSACLQNINFTIKPGTTFAIIGATGSGKSSIINLIPRFYDVNKGQILLDGEDIKSFSQKDITDNISLAPQRAILFKGDIKSNVLYGSNLAVPDNDQGLRQALKIAQATFVSCLKNGVHEEVAQGGTNFSGGQKQRLSIARAVYKRAPILILDDTFSALDYRTDMLVRKGLREELKGTTVIIVAQRIGTIKNADQILVIDKGKMVGLGKHATLLKTCKIYREIALSQLKESEL